MASGFGVDPTKDGAGAITSGTTSQDLRQINSALYQPGILSGGVVTTSASELKYTVSAGVGCVPVATGETMLVPIPAVSVYTTAPASGTRTDIVYVQQRFPSVEGDSTVVVGVAEVLPPRAIELRTYTVSAGSTNTNSASIVGYIDFSIPYGGGLGVLHHYVDTFTGNTPTSLNRIAQGTITLPTDRRLLCTLTTNLQSNGAVGFDNSKYCEAYFLPNFDGGDYLIWTTGGLHQALQTWHFQASFNIAAGTHTVNLGRGRMVGPGNPHQFNGIDSSGFGRVGLEYTISDAGVIY